MVGHEYFHNWTGNRITCRDWFQLSLTEGLTVFRDQEFSMDMVASASARATVRIANVTRFGLGSNAWTNDPAEQERFVRDLEAGAVFINGMTASFNPLPFGGVKTSGYGRELAAHGMREFTNVKAVWVGEGGPDASTARSE